MRKTQVKLLIINANYPDGYNFYGDNFVHTRAREYLRFFDVRVIGWNQYIETDRNYEYQKIPVSIYVDLSHFCNAIIDHRPDVIAVHIAHWRYLDFLEKIDIPIVVWIHGYEGLGWYRRLFSIRSLRHLATYIFDNTQQLWHLRKFINASNQGKPISFVFVSKWMHRITQSDTCIRIKNHSIIPNPIDTELFRTLPRTEDHRKKVLLIRSFDTRKYANDLAIEAILLIKRRSFFSDLSFSIYGKGALFEKLTARLRDLPNVQLHNYFVENQLIPAVHQDFGIFLCPTRQDAQGVSMCEAMSSGLVPITSYNTAIPEFVTDSVDGFATKSAAEIAECLEFLYYNPRRFIEMSVLARASIRSTCSSLLVTQREVDLLNRLAEHHTIGATH